LSHAVSGQEVLPQQGVGESLLVGAEQRKHTAGCHQNQPQARRRPPRLDGKAEARLIALACAAAPDGRKAWTLQLLADRLVELRVVDTVSKETVRRALKKTPSSRT
jgi:hypothetical protein